MVLSALMIRRWYSRFALASCVIRNRVPAITPLAPAAKSGAGIGAGGDTAGQENRALPGRRQRLWQEIQSRHGSDEMATGLAPLSDQTVSAPGDGGACLRLGTDHHEDEDSGIAEVLDKPAPLAERQHDDIDAGVDADRYVGATDEGHQQVYRDGATRGLCTHLINRRS